MKIVIDTNVLFTALNSNQGASYKLVSMIPSKKFSIALSVPLIIEYEAVLRRGKLPPNITDKDVTDFIDFICQVGEEQDIFFLWRPFLPDPFDDLVLEVAVAGDCDAIITYNKKHFIKVKNFGLRVLTPKELLTEIGVIS